MSWRTLAIALLSFARAVAAAEPPPLQDHYADVNGVRLHYVDAGNGALIVFLHGFPEFWYQWKPQLAEFEKDFHVVAPDMRGYNLSDKPAGVEQYRMPLLVEDVHALAHALGYRKFVLVGQDFGGVVAWAYALKHPESLEKIVILNAPHPAIFDRELKENPAQQYASRYMLAVRDPAADQPMLANDCAALVRTVLADGLKAGRFDEQDRAAYLAAWKQPGAIDAGLNYYRAARVGPPDPKTGAAANGNYTPQARSTVVKVPTLLIWGLQDKYLLSGNLSGIEKYVPGVTVKLLPDASHWVNHEKAAEVNAAIRGFLAGDAK